MIRTNEHHGSGLTSYCSWDRLNGLLHRAGELRPHETLIGVKVDETGFQYYVSEAPREQALQR